MNGRISLARYLHAAIGPAIVLLLALVLVSGCSLVPAATPLSTGAAPVSDGQRDDGLKLWEHATLRSLRKVDDYPLYTMHYGGNYTGFLDAPGADSVSAGARFDAAPAWACALFAALGDGENLLYGRNFDWTYSPMLLLVTEPRAGYATISLVDLEYFDFGDTEPGALLDLSLADRRPLLDAPFMPFDGMNSAGLVVGMAAVPSSKPPYDETHPNVSSLMMIRILLDQAGDVDEAIALLGRYNIDWGGGPALHYLIADASGRAVLVEFRDGEMIVIENEDPWHLATNYLVHTAESPVEGLCWRYDLIDGALRKAGGSLAPGEAMDLLDAVSVGGTQWSAVYEISQGAVNLVVGREYDRAYRLKLDNLTR